MKVKTLSVFFVAALLLAGTSIGCDNRSQLEKDADKAMKNVEDGANKALDKIGN